MSRTNTSQTSFHKPFTGTLKRSCAIGAIAMSGLALAPAAHAQSACGEPENGVVTCSPDGNPYPNGITYFPNDELTIVLEDGVVVDTSGGFDSGLLLLGDADALTVNGATNTSITSGQFGFTVLAATNDGDLTLNLDQVTGVLSGIDASSANGAIAVNANNVTTSGAGATALSATGGSGDVTVDVGTITTTGAGSDGIIADTDGDVTVDFDTVTTTGTGVSASGGSSSIVAVNGGSVTTSGDGAIGIDASGNFAIGSTGNVGVVADSVSTSGDDADAISVESRFSTASVDVGAVNTSGDDARGIVAIGNTANIDFDAIMTTGSGATGIVVPGGSLFVRPSANVVISGGDISTGGDDAAGINLSASETASVMIGSVTTTGDGSTGILVPEGTGGFFGSAPTPSAMISATSITTSGDNAAGVDATVTDDLTVSVGSVSTAGTASNAIAATSTDGDVSVAVTGDVVTMGDMVDAVVINSGGSASLTIGADGSIAGTGNSVTINSVAGTSIANSGTLNAADNGFALQVAGGAATIDNSGTLSSDFQLTDADDTLTNSGTILVSGDADFGDGDDLLTNSGTVSFFPAADMTNDVTFTGLESFANNGAIELRNGQVGDTLTLPGDYVGTDGTLGLDVDVAADNADQLIIGGAATGTTTVFVDNTQAVLNSGTTIVQAGAASQADAFVAGNTAGLVQLDVVYDPTTMNFNLVGTPGDTAFRTVGIVEAGRNIWRKSADAWSAQMRSKRDGTAAYGAGEPSARVWVQMFGSDDERNFQRTESNFGVSRVVDSSYNQDNFGGQLGIDFGGASGSDGGFAFGVTGGYSHSRMDFVTGPDRVDFDAVNGGVYASYNAGIVFINALGKYDRYFIDAVLDGVGNDDLEADVYGGQIEAGLRFGSSGFFVEPVGSISYIKSDFDDLGIATSNFSFDEDEGLRGKLGARVGTTFNALGSLVSLYAGGNYVHEFDGEDTVAFTNGGNTIALQNANIGDYGEGVVGVNIGSADGPTAFIEAHGARSDDFDETGARAGVRFRF